MHCRVTGTECDRNGNHGSHSHFVLGGLRKVCGSCPSLPRDQLGSVTEGRGLRLFLSPRAINTGKCLLLLGGVRVAGWCLAIHLS